MQDREVRELRRRVDRLRRGRGHRFPPFLCERITAWVRGRGDRGDWWCDLLAFLHESKNWARRLDRAFTCGLEGAGIGIKIN